MGLTYAAPPAMAAAGCTTTTPTIGQTVTCNVAGTETITIPAGATDVSVVVIGGGGRGGNANGATGGAGGAGAKVSGTLSLPSGDTSLVVTVGAGATSAFINGGGMGGGYSMLTRSTSAALVIAGGGGGGGFSVTGTYTYARVGGAGGSGGAGASAAGGSGGAGTDAYAVPVGYGGGGGSGGSGGSQGSGEQGSGAPGSSWALGGGGGAGASYGWGGGGGSGYGGGGGGGVGNNTGGGGGAGGSYVDTARGTLTFASAGSTGAGSGGVGATGGSAATAGTDGSVQLTFLAAPTLTSVAPTTGPVAGGMYITLTGTNLSGATGVTFGTADATITYALATQLQAILPSGYGTKDVSVTTPGGTATLADAFTYGSPTISSVSPTSGPALGGTSVYIDGTNLTYATGVTVGGVAGTITSITDTRVTALVPASTTTGAVDVVVTAQGPATATKSGAFTYTASAPAAPTSVTATAGIESATVSWTPGANGGQPITGYTVTSSPGSLTCTTTTATSCTVSGLTANTAYTFTVKATNDTGTSPASAASNSVTALPKSAPGQPTSVTATSGIESASVSWTAPASDGGSAITGYTVTSSPDSLTCTTTTATSCVVSGLTAGTSYTFTVTATNTIGTGSASAASTAIIAGAATAPGAPTGVTATPGILKATVSWTAPVSDGGRAISGYSVTSSPGSLTCTTTSATSCDVTGLAANTTYTFTVVAMNVIGPSSPSTASNAIVPSHPTITAVNPPTGSANGGTTVTISGTNLSGATAVTFSGVAATIQGTPTSTSVTVLTPAVSAVGSVNVSVTVPGPATETVGNAYAFTADAPGSPTSAGATAGIESAAVTWTAPSLTGGQAVTGYTVTSSPGSLTCTSATTSCTVNGLTAGTAYTFSVTATNPTGTSSPSAASSAVTALAPTAPGAPTSVTATPGVRQAVVSWTAPASDGGRPITSYTVTSNPGSVTCTTTSGTSCTVTGLTNLGSYTFTVKAANAIGASNASAPSASVTLVEPTVNAGGISPSMGTALGGTEVTISGSNLANASSVTFGGAAGTIVSSSGSTIVVTTPPSSTSSSVDVVITVPGPGTVTVNGGFLYLQSGPSEPTGVTATLLGSDGATVSWTAPALSGSSPITGYTVTSSPGALTCSSATTSCAVAGMTVGTSYTFTVIAMNVDGPSSPSAPSNAVVHSGGGGGGGTGGGGTGGGGGSGSDSGGGTSSPSAAAPQAPAETPAAPAALATPTIDGYSPPKRIRVPGRTVLVRSSLRTTAGAPVTATASVRRALRTPASSPVGARIAQRADGRVTVVTTGRYAVVVRLVLTAPATQTTSALNEVYTWRVQPRR